MTRPMHNISGFKPKCQKPVKLRVMPWFTHRAVSNLAMGVDGGVNWGCEMPIRVLPLFISQINLPALLTRYLGVTWIQMIVLF